MTRIIELHQDKASEVEILEHLSACDFKFLLTLTSRIDIEEYVNKIYHNAFRFEAWDKGVLVGLVASYCNDKIHYKAHITNVTVLPAWQGNKIATQLLNRCIEYAKMAKMKSVGLEVVSENTTAINLYKKNGFLITESSDSIVHMNLFL